MKKKYYYPAFIEKMDFEGYSVEFPDIPNITTDGDTFEEAYENSEEALGLYLFHLYETGKEFPNATKLEMLKDVKDKALVIAKVDFLEVIKENDNKAVKKTLTIPSWLNTMAEKEQINFSKLLQKSLIETLNVRK